MCFGSARVAGQTSHPRYTWSTCPTTALLGSSHLLAAYTLYNPILDIILSAETSLCKNYLYSITRSLEQLHETG